MTNHADQRAIGAAVRAHREARGLTQVELAARIGVNQPSVSRIEHGYHLPGTDTLLRLSRALNVSLDELCAGGLP